MEPPLLPRRVTQLREPANHQTPAARPPNSAIPPRGGANRRSNAPPLSSSSTQTNATPGEAPRTGPGRPPLVLRARVQRALVNLYLSTDLKLQTLALGVQKVGGPAREKVRRFLSDSLEAGDKTDTELSQVRLREPDLVKQRELKQYRAFEASRRNEESEHALDESSRPQKRLRRSLDGSSTENVPHAFSQQRHADNPLQTVVGASNDMSSTHDRIPRGERHVASKSTPQSLAEPLPSTQLHVSEQGAQPISEATARDPSISRPSGRIADGADSNHRGRETNLRKRKSPRSDFSFSELAKEIGGIKKRSFYLFLLKRVSLSKDTIASRLSTMSARPSPRTHNSDFFLYYYDLRTFSGTELAPASTAVNILMQAWKDHAGDESALNNLIRALPKDEDQQLPFLNAVDRRGVSALHLATAYGYLRTCGFLIRHNVDHTARTRNNENICAFARPAQRLATSDIKLYGRIINCREFASKNRVPPVPRSKTESQRVSDEQSRQVLNRGMQKARSCPPTGPHRLPFDEEELRSTTMVTASDDQPIEFTGANEPRFGSQFFDSPTPTIHNNPSLPFLNDDYNRFVPLKPKHQGTLDSIVSRPPYQKLQAVPAFEPTSNSAMANVMTECGKPPPPQDAYQPPILPSSNRGQPRRRKNVYGDMADSEFNLQQGVRSNPDDILDQPINELRQSTFQFDQPLWNLGRPLEQPLTQPNNTDTQSYSYVTSAGPAHNIQIDAFDFAPRNFGPSYGHPTHMLPQVDRDGYSTSFVGTQDHSQAGRYGYGQDHIASVPSQIDYNQSMSYTTTGVPLPTVQGGAQHQYPTNNDSQSRFRQYGEHAYVQGGLVNTCPLGYQQCDGDTLCDFCSSEMMQQYMPTVTM